MEVNDTARDDLASGSERDHKRVDETTSPKTETIEPQRAVSSREGNTEHSHAQTTAVKLPKRKLSREEYTVGWICAITVERVAAEVFLDETHANPEFRDEHDDNIYLLGKFGEHNTVIATLPEGEYGTNSAASVANNMVRSFPNIRFGLMVGVGGGAPSTQHDIRLGDVVVSSPGNGYHGVFQYGFGKSVQGEAFHTTGFLNAPPRLLRNAVASLKAEYEKDDCQLRNTIDTLLQTSQGSWKERYKRPEASSDTLYCSDFKHRSNHGDDCKDSCGLDSRVLVTRQARPFNNGPLIHYGLIASGNSLIKDAKIRDKLGAEKGVLCFEMEAAGLMNQFPCLVIRGICDYSDSHKNKAWQPYAAVAAAAYTKDLLLLIPPLAIQTAPKASEVLSEIRQVVQGQLDIAKENQDTSKETEKQKCHQTFRLTTSGKDSTYEWYKDRIEKRVEGTCSWFLRHTNFKNWHEHESGPLLVSADPGCGKSVLAKYLVDEVLPGSATVCYFFFKDQDQNTIRQALCALLHQLFTQNPALIEHALELFRQNGKGLVDNNVSLWNILQAAAQDPRAGPIILVFDALDECSEQDFTELMKMIRKQLRDGKENQSKLKYLLTSRPYEQIVAEFRPLLDQFPLIRIPGEDDSEAIIKEVNLVISHQVDQLSEVKDLSHDISEALKRKFQEIPHRTYLWVYLVFDVLRRTTIKKTSKAFENFVSELPRNVNEAYEQILSKSEDQDMARKALAIILVAKRPLTVSEMNLAMNIHNESTSFSSLDLETDEDFRSTFRSWRGLFVSIHHDKIYFLHQTAREFLLGEPPRDASSKMKWHSSVSIEYAHGVLAELCVRYLDFFNCMDDSRVAVKQQGAQPFLDYAASFWGDHFRIAENALESELLPLVLRICNPDSNAYQSWFRIFSTKNLSMETKFTELMIASYFGHVTVAMPLIDQGADLESKGDELGRTPLSWAAARGHEAVVKLLIDQGADLKAKDQMPLSFAAEEGHEAVVKLLIDQGADLEAKDDELGQTPLSWAAEEGHEAVVKLLIDQGADLEAKDDEFGQTPLLRAAAEGHEAVVKLLINKGADIEAKGENGRTPLWLTASCGHEATVAQLLEKRCSVDVGDKKGITPLVAAATRGHWDTVQLLLEADAGADGRESSLWAASVIGLYDLERRLNQEPNAELQDLFGIEALFSRNGL
uniref:NACHT domain-containing protein n=1 Tax=Bionectria ochroleuca TaxID=29856 RepID=A0A0B7KH92_BIOOC